MQHLIKLTFSRSVGFTLTFRIKKNTSSIYLNCVFYIYPSNELSILSNTLTPFHTFWGKFAHPNSLITASGELEHRGVSPLHLHFLKWNNPLPICLTNSTLTPTFNQQIYIHDRCHRKIQKNLLTMHERFHLKNLRLKTAWRGRVSECLSRKWLTSMNPNVPMAEEGWPSG